MISRKDFIFTIGYQGDTAIVDGNNRKMYGNLGGKELAGKGLYKPAVCSAAYSGDQEEQRAILDIYNEKSGSAYDSFEDLMKVFGVFGIPENIVKVKIIR